MLVEAEILIASLVQVEAQRNKMHCRQQNAINNGARARTPAAL